MSVNQALYEFTGRYRIALKKDEALLEQDRPNLTKLINLCVPHIPAHLHAEIFTTTCCFAVVKSADKSFTIHVAFTKHNLIVKCKMEYPCNGSCSFYKLGESKVPPNIQISTLKDEVSTEEEEWCIVSSKERDALLMPPPPSRRPRNKS